MRKLSLLVLVEVLSTSRAMHVIALRRGGNHHQGPVSHVSSGVEGGESVAGASTLPSIVRFRSFSSNNLLISTSSSA